MTPRRLDTKLLLRPEDLSPSRDDFEVVGVFNPGAVKFDDEVVLLVRVAERPREKRAADIGLPRWDMSAGLDVDWIPEDHLSQVDARVVKRKSDGLVRLTFTSHLRVVRCGDGRTVRDISGPLFLPETSFEEYGVEDPRITFVDGQYCITYVAVSRHGPATALATTTDFRTFERHGIVFCPENKDVVLFPEKIEGSFAALHRPVCGTPFTRPEIWVARSPDLIHWGGHLPIAISGKDWQSGRVGGGAPPIHVEAGWLTIYHGNRRANRAGDVGAYFGGAMLLDAHDPARVLAQLPEPFLIPELDFEMKGFVPNVVFPTGIVRDDGSLLVYYGAADTCTAVAIFSERELLQAFA